MTYSRLVENTNLSDKEWNQSEPTLVGWVKYAWLGLAIFYSLLCYCIFNDVVKRASDFACYYGSSHVLVAGDSPYQTTKDLYSPLKKYLAPNPNPPLTLLLFSGFSYFSYPVALVLWFVFSTALGVLGAMKCFQLFFNEAFFKRYRSVLLIMYLTAFPVLSDTVMLQWGGVLLYLFAQGYEAYLNENDFKAGFWWGLWIALKLFPGLLLIYVFLKRRYQLMWVMLGWAVGLTFLPAMKVGGAVYHQYVQLMMKGMVWYGVNWNISLKGFLFRSIVLLKAYSGKEGYCVVGNLEVANSLYLLFTCLVFGYWLMSFKKLEQGTAYRGMAFLLVLMLFLSPMGWLYYVPILLLPVVCTFGDSLKRVWRMVIWLIAVFLLFFPIKLTHAIEMPSTMLKLSFYSVHFYGLLLLGGLAWTTQTSPREIQISDIPAYIKHSLLAVWLFGFSYLVLRLLVVLWIRVVEGVDVSY